MLGLALSEAKRSEELGLRLRQQPNNRRRRRRRKAKPLACPKSVGQATSTKLHDKPMGKQDLYFCLRCSVVAVGKDGTDRAVGRVTIVNWDHDVVLDKFVKVPLRIVDCRTEETGITKADLHSREALTFDQARTEVGNLIKGKILIGYGLEMDLAALGLTHPVSDIRDTAAYTPFMKPHDDRLMPKDLVTLAAELLNRQLTVDPLNEASACMDLYRGARTAWETDLIRIVQQKEEQRQLILQMRGGPRPPSVPLSAIREDEEARRTNVTVLSQQPESALSPYYSGSTSSWLSETELTSNTNGSLVCQETWDSSSSVASLRSMDSRASASVRSVDSRSSYTNSVIDNMTEMFQGQAIGSLPLPPSDQPWYHRRSEQPGSVVESPRPPPPPPLQGLSVHANAWTPRSSAWNAPTVESRTSSSSVDLGQPPSPPPHAEPGTPNTMVVGSSLFMSPPPVPPSTPQTSVLNHDDAHMLRHLPSQLMEDLDMLEFTARGAVHSNDHNNINVSKWFRPLRKTYTHAE